MAKVHGLSDFQRRWNAIPELVRVNMRAELEDIAEDIVAQMYARAPQRSGDLAGSIQWTWGAPPASSLTIGSVSETENADNRITIFAGDKDAFYARFQEFGTANMPANPFFYPVWRHNRRRVRSRLLRALRKAIRQA